MKANFMKILEKALALSRGDETEVLYAESRNALTRFANNAAHQNMITEDRSIQFRVVKNGRRGGFSTNILDDDSLKNAAEAAFEIALAQKPDEDFPGLPKATKPIEFDAAAGATMKCSPARRARMVKDVIKIAKKNGVIAAGALSTSTQTIAVANSSGVRARQRITRAKLNMAPVNEPLSGHAQWSGADIDAMPHLQIAEEAVKKAAHPGEPFPLEPGQYTVVLSPYATATLVIYLSYIGFGARAFMEGRSFMTKKRGEKVCSDKISILDDGHDPSGLPLAFDYEGVPKRKVFFIKKGVATDVVHDSRTAAKMKSKNTGHALPAPNAMGPMALNLVMRAGRTKEENLIKPVRRGLYITKFHYTNIVDPMQTVMTGMTRDGTFLIEDGEITRPVRNLRWTQNVLTALMNVEAIGKERRCVAGYFNSAVVPSLRIAGFTFTGVSDNS